MRTLSYNEYLTLPADERRKYDFVRSVKMEVVNKGRKNGNSYFLDLEKACLGGKAVEAIDINDDGDIYAIINGDKIYSENWTWTESMQLMEIAQKAKVLQVKDQWHKPIEVGNKVIFIHSYGKEDKRLVKAEVTKIELGNSENACKIYLTDFEVGVSYCEDSPTKITDLVKYKRPYTLVVIQ